jgi:hypothetical protein
MSVFPSDLKTAFVSQQTQRRSHDSSSNRTPGIHFHRIGSELVQRHRQQQSSVRIQPGIVGAIDQEAIAMPGHMSKDIPTGSWAPLTKGKFGKQRSR